MFAVIRTGGKQYKVAAGDVIAVERLPLEEGSHFDLDQVLMIGDGASMTVGAPLVAGAVVAATVVEQTKGDKVIVFKKKRRQNYRRKRGHRQLLTMLHIDQIVPAGAERKARTAPKRKVPKPEAKPEAKAAAKPAPKKAAKAKKETKAAKPAAKKAPAKAKKEKK